MLDGIIFIILIALIIGLGKVARDAGVALEVMQESYNKLLSQKKSSEVRLGQISENLAPFLTAFKYDPKKAHFMGMPVDYVIFDDDEVVFLEIKSGKAQLSPTQRKIKALIQAGKVRWDEMRINDGVTSLAVPVVEEAPVVEPSPPGTFLQTGSWE